MNRRRFAILSAGALNLLSLHSVGKPVLGAEFELGEVDKKRPTDVTSINVYLSKIEILPQYLDSNSNMKVSVNLAVEGYDDETKTAENISFNNGEKVDSTDIQDQTGVDLQNIEKTGISTDAQFLDCQVSMTVNHQDTSKKFRQSFTIAGDNVFFEDDFAGSEGTSLGSNYLISQGVRRPRNTDTTNFTVKEDGNSNQEMSHSGDSGDNTFIEVALDTNSLSNNKWTVNLYGQSWTYNSQENNYRMGIVDRTDNTNFCEFRETESLGVDPSVAANNINQSSVSTDVSFSGGTSYDWSFQMRDGTITVYKDGSEVLSKSGFPSGEYTWFAMNEQDTDTSRGETHLLDKLEVLR